MTSVQIERGWDVAALDSSIGRDQTKRANYLRLDFAFLVVDLAETTVAP
jgi:hypothetical protein